MRNKKLIFMIVVAIATCIVRPTFAVDDNATSRQNVEKGYHSCQNGYYSGPRPGRNRYTKDPWLWVVTPEFAKNFCMPTEFVSNDLIGAEAIAFKMVEDQNEEICGFGGKVEVCNRRKELRFEVYVKSASKVPKKPEVYYFNPASLSSKFLISKNEQEMRAAEQSVKKHPRLGALGVFNVGQVVLGGVKDNKIVWPITALGPRLFYSEVSEGIDYFAFGGMSGNFNNARMEKQNVRRFVILFNNFDGPRLSIDGAALNTFPYLIELPEDFSNKVRAADKALGDNYETLGKRAFGIDARK